MHLFLVFQTTSILLTNWLEICRNIYSSDPNRSHLCDLRFVTKQVKLRDLNVSLRHLVSKESTKLEMMRRATVYHLKKNKSQNIIFWGENLIFFKTINVTKDV